MAGSVVEDQPVFPPVQRIALVEDRPAHQLHVRQADCRRIAWHSERVIGQGREMGQHHRARQFESRVHGDDAVELLGIALRRDQRLAPAVGTAPVIGTVRLPAVVTVDHAAPDAHHLADRGIGVVEHGLLVAGKAGARGDRGIVSAVSGDDGKAAVKRARRGRGTGQVAERRIDAAVEPPATLEDQPAVPLQRQAHLDPETICHAVRAGAFLETPGDGAMIGRVEGRRSVAPATHRHLQLGRSCRDVSCRLDPQSASEAFGKPFAGRGRKVAPAIVGAGDPYARAGSGNSGKQCEADQAGSGHGGSPG